MRESHDTNLKVLQQTIKWQEGVVDTVFWTSIWQAISKMRVAKFRQSSKDIYGWLPRDKARVHMTGTSGYTVCRRQVETLNHVLE